MNEQMIISLQEIPEEGLVWEKEIPVDQFPMLLKISSEEEIGFLSSVSAKVQIMPRHGLFEVSGIVKIKMTFVCGRCLDVFEMPIEGKIYISYAEELPKVEDTTGEEMELSAEDMGILLLQDSYIDLAEMIEEQIILEIPYSPLCSNQCQGLCHICGTSLNHQKCNCSSQKIDPRWEALQKLQRQ